MNNTVWGLALCAAAATATATATADDNPPKQQITPAGSQASSFGSAEYFTGRVRVDPLFTPNASINASAAYVSFEPGARSAWHTHPAG